MFFICRYLGKIREDKCDNLHCNKHLSGEVLPLEDQLRKLLFFIELSGSGAARGFGGGFMFKVP